MDQAAAARPPLVLHYHLFKNAGTSVDAMLRANFGERFGTAEFDPAAPDGRAQDVAGFLRRRPDLDAFSSHTALLPLPVLPDRSVFPVLFLRHPLLRIRSAYGFERRQATATPSARLARTHDFAGYVRALLDAGSGQVRNFQATRLALAVPPDGRRVRPRAVEAMEALPFVGLVEAYADSVQRLARALARYWPHVRPVVAHENAAPAPQPSPADQLLEVRAGLGDGLYEELRLRNRADQALVDRVGRLYGVELPAA